MNFKEFLQEKKEQEYYIVNYEQEVRASDKMKRGEDYIALPKGLSKNKLYSAAEKKINGYRVSVIGVEKISKEAYDEYYS